MSFLKSDIQEKHLSDAPSPPADRVAALVSLWLAAAAVSIVTAGILWIAFSPAANVPFVYDKVVFGWELLAALLMSFFPALVISHLLMARGWRRTAWVLFIVSQWGICAFVIGDMSIYRVTSNHLDAYFMFLFQPQLLTIGGGAGLIVSRVLELLSMAAAVILVAAAAGVALRRLLSRGIPSRRLIYIVPAFYLLPIVSVAVAQRYVRSYPDLFAFVASLPFDLSRFGMSPVPPDAAPFSTALSKTMKQSLVRWAQFTREPPRQDAQVRLNRQNPPSVVILLIDSLRRDMFDSQYMPRLCAYARNGMVFLNHRPGVNGTAWAMFDITYGRYSVFLRSMLDHALKPELPAIFNRSGYHTLYLEGHDDSSFYEMWKYVGPRSGFDETIVRSHGDQWDAADADIYQYIAARLSHSSRPIMALALLSGVHYPYYYPPAWQKLTPVMDTHAKAVTDMNPKTDRTPLFNRYKNAVAYEDHLIGDFLDRIDLKKTTVLILGDHGESFWEDGYLTHAGPMSQIVMSSPCVWLGAGVPARQVKRITQHVDLLPTLLHVIEGRHVPLLHADGWDVLDNPPPRDLWIACPPFSNSDGLTFIVDGSDDGMELYWSYAQHRLEFQGKITPTGRLLPFTIPSVDEAPPWGRQIAPLLVHLSH
jgi:membrane-anchored protein YejM (alkaline phosphatase superfamily)